MGKDNNGFPWLVLGTKDGACYSIQAPAWTAEAPQVHDAHPGRGGHQALDLGGLARGPGRVL